MCHAQSFTFLFAGGLGLELVGSVLAGLTIPEREKVLSPSEISSAWENAGPK